jgi:molybdopterin converting factor small subunit
MAAIDLLYFGALRDRIGRDHEQLETPSHVLTIEDLVAWLVERGAPYREALDGPIAGAIDQQRAGPGDNFFGAKEVALFPPPRTT